MSTPPWGEGSDEEPTGGDGTGDGTGGGEGPADLAPPGPAQPPPPPPPSPYAPGGAEPHQPYPAYQPPQPPPNPYGGAPSPYQTARPTNGLAVGAMVTSIVAAASICFCGVTGILGIVGAILGHMSRRQIKERNEQGDGMALAGVIVGWISFGLTLAFIALIVVLIVIGAMDSYDPTDPYEY